FTKDCSLIANWRSIIINGQLTLNAAVLEVVDASGRRAVLLRANFVVHVNGVSVHIGEPAFMSFVFIICRATSKSSLVDAGLHTLDARERDHHSTFVFSKLKPSDPFKGPATFGTGVVET